MYNYTQKSLDRIGRVIKVNSRIWGKLWQDSRGLLRIGGNIMSENMVRNAEVTA